MPLNEVRSLLLANRQYITVN
ncbi:uncharacterized protein FFC1_06518 [Fusarium fujikuroi]|nr:uncharacterized protein FFC1_06518 [Fusarium fujikuroi]